MRLLGEFLVKRKLRRKVEFVYSELKRMDAACNRYEYYGSCDIVQVLLHSFCRTLTKLMTF